MKLIQLKQKSRVSSAYVNKLYKHAPHFQLVYFQVAGVCLDSLAVVAHYAATYVVNSDPLDSLSPEMRLRVPADYEIGDRPWDGRE